MLSGVKLLSYPTSHQKLILSQWMGCHRFIWNSKVEEELYYHTFAKKYSPIGTYSPIDQTTSQFKSKELTPWLYNCPSQILRNSATNWYNTYQKFMKGKCGRPKRKSKMDRGSLHLTKELFHFDICSDGNIRLFIGSKTNNIGYLLFKKHKTFKLPNSMYICKNRGKYTISFCYEDSLDESSLLKNDEHLDFLRCATDEYLENNVIACDRGVAIPVHTGESTFDFTEQQKQKMERSERYIKRLQRRMARQVKGSNRRTKTKRRIVKQHAKKANIRNDFAHKTSRSLVNGSASVIIFEDLKTSNMTKRAKPKKDENGKYISNNAAQKTGLNKAILNVGWYNIENYTKYKAYRAGKAVFKIPAHHTSQECSQCGHTHPNNRKTQDRFVCLSCGYADNADKNASLVCKKRAIKLIKHTGTVLSERGVLTILSDTGRGGKSKTGLSVGSSSICQRNVKKEKLEYVVSDLEARRFIYE